MSRHFIYLLQTGYSLRYNEGTYKIGRTKRKFGVRAGEYDKGTEVILSLMVDDGLAVENKIIHKFDKIFVKRRDLGSEYYSGDVTIMSEIIKLIVSMRINEQAALIQKPIIENNLKNMRTRQLRSLLNREVPSLLRNSDIHDNIEIDAIVDISADGKSITHLNENSSDAELNENSNDFELNEDSSDIELNKNSRNSGQSTISLDNNIEKNIIRGDGIIRTGANILKEIYPKTLKSFFKHIYESEPSWYTPGKMVKLSVIESAYREYFNDEKTKKSVISKRLKDKLYNFSTRTDNISKKRLVKYEALKKLF